MTQFRSGDHAREMNRRANEARRKLTKERARELLGPLETIADAKRWAQQAYEWTVTKKITPPSGHACASLIREWRQLHELGASHDAIEALRKTVREVTAERDRLQKRIEQLELERHPARPRAVAE